MLIPQPKKEEILAGSYTFKNEYDFDKTYKYAYKYLSSFIKLSENAEKIKLKMDCSYQKEEYTLLIDDGISITARDEEGIFRALSTLKQLVKKGTVNKQKIHDCPDVKIRSLMIDISRGKIPKLHSIKDTINILRDVKYNQLQLYIDGLVFEFEHFKKHTKGTDILTVAELEEIKSYCEESFIELSVTLNSFGHMEKWLKLPEYSDLAIKREDGKQEDTLNPFDERSVELVDTIFSDILPYFNSDYINIGMDEPFSLGMGQTKELCDKLGKSNVYIDYLNKIIKLCNEKHNKIPMFFDDIVFEEPSCIDKIKGNCVVMDWGYEIEMPFYERCGLLKEKGLKFYTCPGTSSWGSLTGRFDNMMYNIANSADACIKHNGEGVMLTDWGDNGNPQFIAISYLPYIFNACCTWNYKASVFTSNACYAEKLYAMRYVKEYADTFIFNGKKVSDILHRMANYYLLENNNGFNGTYVVGDTEQVLSDNEPTLNKNTLELIISYMSYLRSELTALDGDTPYIDEIICNCDMVILQAEFIISAINKEKNTDLIEKLEQLKKTFKELWIKNSHNCGYDIYCEYLDRMISKIKNQ